jgi:hypothetical protein
MEQSTSVRSVCSLDPLLSDAATAHTYTVFENKSLNRNEAQRLN